MNELNKKSTLEVADEGQSVETGQLQEMDTEVVSSEESKTAEVQEGLKQPSVIQSKIPRQWIIGGIGLFLLLLVIGMVVKFSNQTEDCLYCGGNSDALVDGELERLSYEELKASLQSEVDKSYMNLKININPVFESGKSKGNLMIQNSKDNLSNMKVFIFMEDTKELLYESPIIAPNQSVVEDVLIKDLDAGTYNCVATFYILDPETHQKINEAGIKITLTVNQ